MGWKYVSLIEFRISKKNDDFSLEQTVIFSTEKPHEEYKYYGVYCKNKEQYFYLSNLRPGSSESALLMDIEYADAKLMREACRRKSRAMAWPEGPPAGDPVPFKPRAAKKGRYEFDVESGEGKRLD